MKKALFEETYAKTQKAKKAYHEATSEAEQAAARELYKKATEGLAGLGNAELQIWSDYETSRDRGNEYLDISGTVRDSEVEHLIACMRNCGIEAFTFSSTWSGAVETAWLFQKAGCTLAGLVEINSHYDTSMREGYAKAHGYLFKVN